MYLKLTWRNVKRSVNDYLLYAVTMILLIGIMLCSNYIAAIGKVEAGFQTESLPILITLILIILVGYMNHFMLKQRAKELANYILLGMEQNKLSWMFIIEYWIIGILCFIAGSFVGIIFCVIFSHSLFYLLEGFEVKFLFLVQSIGKTLFYVCIVEICSVFYIKKMLNKICILKLMNEKKRVQKLGGRKQCRNWGILFMISFFILTSFILGITFLPEDIASYIISFIAVPFFIVIVSFYKWLYQYLSVIRQTKPEALLHKNRLYIYAQMTFSIQTNAVMNSIFCICLFLSLMSFFTGAIMLQPEISIFEQANQKWMGILQISLCIVFNVIYFSILSLQQIVDLKRETKDISILSYIGKDTKQLKYLIKIQIFLNSMLPGIICFLLLIVGIPCANYKLNSLLPVSLKHIILKLSAIFIGCYLILYGLYSYIVYRMSLHSIKMISERSMR